MYGTGRYARRKRKKFWVGWNGRTATDALTGAALGLTYIPNEEQEYHAYPRVLAGVIETVGHAPHAVSLDAGYGTKAVYEHNVKLGIATIAPWRATDKNSRRRELEDAVADRHGVPRCRHCGAPGKTSGSGLGFLITDYGTPVIRFRCMAKLTEDCRGVQKRLLHPRAAPARPAAPRHQALQPAAPGPLPEGARAPARPPAL